MKTRNNVQKAARKITIVIAGFFLIGLTVSAQDFWNERVPEYKLTEIVFALAENIKVDKPSAANKNFSFSEYSFLIEESKEEDLELENWMMNEALFIHGTFILEIETEESQKLENWMTDDTIFNVTTKNTSNLLDNEIEEELILEDWITNDKIWK